jgi:hypothetical protein
MWAAINDRSDPSKKSPWRQVSIMFHLAAFAAIL